VSALPGADHWNLEPITSTRQISGRVVRIECEPSEVWFLKKIGAASEPALHEGMAREYRVLELLSRSGVRVALPRPTMGGDMLASASGGLYALYAGLTGAHLDVWSAERPEREAYRLGHAIGRLHQAMPALTAELADAFPQSNLQADVRRAADQLAGTGLPDPAGRFAVIQAEYDAAMAATYPDLPRHLIHRDAHPSNIIFDAAGEAGFLDFELLRVECRLFDPCYCSTALLAERFDDPGARRSWTALFGQVIAGYASACPLMDAEHRALRYLPWAIQLIFAGWWARQGDLERARSSLEALYWLYDHALPESC